MVGSENAAAEGEFVTRWQGAHPRTPCCLWTKTSFLDEITCTSRAQFRAKNRVFGHPRGRSELTLPPSRQGGHTRFPLSECPKEDPCTRHAACSLARAEARVSCRDRTSLRLTSRSSTRRIVKWVWPIRYGRRDVAPRPYSCMNMRLHIASGRVTAENRTIGRIEISCLPAVRFPFDQARMAIRASSPTSKALLE